MTKLRPNVKKAWLNALRSGKYEQTREAMLYEGSRIDGTSTSAYCCLGVLTELYLEDKGEEWNYTGSPNDDTPYDDINSEECLYYQGEELPGIPVQKWAFEDNDSGEARDRWGFNLTGAAQKVYERIAKRLALEARELKDLDVPCAYETRKEKEQQKQIITNSLGDKTLYNLNDGGATFNEIADIIEEQF